MKILCTSDLHLDLNSPTWIESLPLAGVDVLSIAGDITTSDAETARYYIESIARHAAKTDTDVVFVLGNHDYYGASIYGSAMKMREFVDELALPNLHFLNQSVVAIKGQRFVGCTLWYKLPFSHYYWPDSRFITNFASTCDNENKLARDFLVNAVQDGDVVVTHMVPSQKCVHPNYQLASTNGFFVSYGVAEDVLSAVTPKLWHFGHTHKKIDVTLGETRFFCNPVGYPGEGVDTDLSHSLEI